MLSLDEFIEQNTGKEGVGDTPENINQCVGLVEVWLDNLGINKPHLYGNAKDLLSNADPAKFDIIHNTPEGVPQSGDVVVWGETWGNGFGHTGIFCSGDVNDFNCFQQNDPEGSTPHAKTYNYNGVLGWLSPKVLDVTEKPVDESKIIEQLKTQVEATSQCQTQLKTANEQVETLQKQLREASEQNLALQAQIRDLNDELAIVQQDKKELQSKYDDERQEVINLNDNIEKMAKSNKDYATEALNASQALDDHKDYLSSIADALDIKEVKNVKDTVESILSEISKHKSDIKSLYQQSLDLLPKIQSPGFLVRLGYAIKNFVFVDKSSS